MTLKFTKRSKVPHTLHIHITSTHKSQIWLCFGLQPAVFEFGPQGWIFSVYSLVKLNASGNSRGHSVYFWSSTAKHIHLNLSVIQFYVVIVCRVVKQSTKPLVFLFSLFKIFEFQIFMNCFRFRYAGPYRSQNFQTLLIPQYRSDFNQTLWQIWYSWGNIGYYFFWPKINKRPMGFGALLNNQLGHGPMFQK